MKKKLIVISFFLSIIIPEIFSQTGASTGVYLLTCGPGTETYSIYGHSALRIIIPEKQTDVVYNWGVFDFSTPNFVWKFAKGRLEYMLIAEPVDRFLQIYYYEKRYVYSQKINLEPDELEKLLNLIDDNLKPENIKYRYDFFYDDCSTRIRDIIEKSVGEKLLYPPAEAKNNITFRDMVRKYQNPYPWLQFGIDLIMGSPGEKKASFRDRMFLPIDMKNGLSETVIYRGEKMIPLLQNHEVILDFDPPEVRHNFLISPSFVFTFLFIVIMILSSLFKTKKINRLFDILVFMLFSILALLMIFFNFFTDHQQMKWNLNILWLNPFIIVCFLLLILNRAGLVWFRIVFFISGVFLICQFFLPQDFNTAFIPLVIILLIRSSVRAGFEWNPFNLR